MSEEVEHFTKEKRVLVAMRKTLSSIVKDVTPSSSAIKSPLTEATIEDIKMCFGLIAAREQEIAKEAGIELNEKPHFTDEAVTSNVVSLDSLKITTTKVQSSSAQPSKEQSAKAKPAKTRKKINRYEIDPSEEGFE
ncbi:hypothetical protein GCM10009133_06220 [Cocleimonas flava]|uniref:Uncharacterized protein n=1 Tax=Cocleimonas flava TaxID=634765 RepID=A0A4R1F138_9GAMM|nr:hypothetical protein [Cocleimonas flava]TCJ86990.1 hypothetical protein EV695_1491 [Cocleimonas flava]